jgi:hypothetical protein
LSLFMLVIEDTWGVPRDPANDPCSRSRGHCPRIACCFNSLIFLFYFCMLAAYVAEVFPSSSIASPSSDGCTRSFFTYGSAGCPSGCCVAFVVALFALSLGSP